MVLTDEQKNERRLNRVAYANIALGLLTLFVWAIPGPAMVPSFWQHIDRTSLANPSSAGTMIVVFKVAIVFFVVLFWLLSAVSLANGFLILKRRRHRLCMILSGYRSWGLRLI